MNYFSKQPPLTDEYYNEENSYAVNDQTWGLDQTLKDPIKKIGSKVKIKKSLNYGNYKREGHYVRYGNYNRDNILNRGNYGNRNYKCGAYVPRKTF